MSASLFTGIAEEIDRLAAEWVPILDDFNRHARISRMHRLKRQRRGRRW